MTYSRSDYEKARYRNKVEKGICTLCPKRATHGLLCLKCRLKTRKRMRAQYAKKPWVNSPERLRLAACAPEMVRLLLVLEGAGVLHGTPYAALLETLLRKAGVR